MMPINLAPYIREKGLVDIDSLLRDYGYVQKDTILSTRIDTVAIAQILRISQKTLNKYINAGLINLDNGRRMTLGDALDLNFQEIQSAAKLCQPFKSKHQKRTTKTR